MARRECIDLFSGAGGLTSGLEKAGFRTVAAVELNRDCCDTYSNAFPDVDLFSEKIQEIDFKKYQGITLIAGGPPCQPFSSGGKGLSHHDERDMLPEFVRAVREAKPKAFLMENVAGLAGVTHSEYFNKILKMIEGEGYSVSYRVLNAADFGIPQKRKRLFLIGLIGMEFEFPKETHGPESKHKHVAVGQVIKINKVNGEPNPSKIVYAKNPDLRPNPYDGHIFNGGGRPLDPTRPAHTILASAGGNKTHFVDTLERVPPYHEYLMKGGKPRSGSLEGGRRLTVKESALLQTFEKSMKFFGSRSSQYTQVGNAVPPRLAEILGKSIIAHLN